MRSEFTRLNADNLIPTNNDGPVASIGPFALALHLNCVAINAKMAILFRARMSPLSTG